VIQLDNLVQTIYKVVKEQPNQVGRIYTQLLRHQGFPNISKHEVNSILYGRRDLFHCTFSGNNVPAWNVIENSNKSFSSATTQIIEPPVRSEKMIIAPPHIQEKRQVQREKYIIENNNYTWDQRFNLYEWQELALNAWQEKGYRGIIEAVTGSGKTRLALAAMDAHLKSGYKVLIIVPYKELMNQWSDVIRNSFHNYSVGYLGDGNRQSLRFVDILIGISNSVQKYKTLPADTKALIIADEVHHYGTPLAQKMLERGYVRRLGLTASLERNDDGVDQVIKSYFGEVEYTYDYSEAIDDNVIAPFKILFLSVQMNAAEDQEYSRLSTRISKLKASLKRKYPKIMLSSSGTFNQKINRLPYMDEEVKIYKASTYKRSQMVVNMPSKLSVVKHLSSLIKGANGAFVFTQLTEINIEISNILKNEGVKIIPMDGGYKPEDRRAILRQFKDRQIEAIAAPKLLDEGIDVPHADLAVITGKSNSRRQLIQRLGRVVRRKQDNGIGRIVILISKDTTEDPDVRDSEAFYEVFEGANIGLARYEYNEKSSELDKYLEVWANER
jgi:RNA polymerase primary sigma factor